MRHALNLASSYMVELQNDRISLTTVHAWMT